MPVYYLHIRRTILCGVLGLLLALIVAALSPKVYEGRMQILVGANQMIRPTATLLYPDVQDILDASTPKDTLSELDVLRGEGVFSDALNRVYSRQQKTLTKEERDRLFMMYDVASAKETAVGEVRARAYDPQVAADLANEIGVVYNELRKRSGQVAVQESLDYLKKQVADSKEQLNAAQKALREYKDKTGMMDVATRYTQKTSELSSLELQLAQAKADYSANIAEVQSLQDQLSRTSAKQEVGTSDQRSNIVQQLEQQQTDLLAKRDSLLAQYLPTAPQVKEVDDQVKAIQHRLAQQKKDFIGVARSTGDNPVYVSLKQQLAQSIAKRDSNAERLKGLQTEIASRQNIVGSMPEFEEESKRLATEESIADSKYRRVKDQFESLKFKTEAAARAAQILYLAQPDNEPVAPNFGKLAAIGAVAGILLGLLYSYVLEAMKLRVYNSGHLTELTGLPVLASVPTLPRPQVRKLQRSLATDDPVVLEPFRFMAFSTLSGNKDRPKSVLFTGVGGTVGTTTSAAQYAIAAARTGAKVILVDYDLQYGTLTRLYGLSEKTGLRDMLSRTVLSTDESLAVPTKEPHLSLVPAGTDLSLKVGDVPFEHLQLLIQLFEKEADLVVVDSPAVDQVSDAARLIPCVDQVCLVVSATATNYRQIMMAQEIIRRAGAKDVALVLSGGNTQDEPFAAQLSALKRPGA